VSRYKRDIILRGTVKGNNCRLTEGLDDNVNRTDYRTALHRDGTHLTGIYTTAQGRTLPMALEIVPSGSVPEPHPDLIFETNEGDRRRLPPPAPDGISLVSQKQEIIGDHYTIRWYLEPHSGERMFRLVAGWPATVMAGINTQLETLQFDNAAADLACAGEGSTSALSRQPHLWKILPRYIRIEVGGL